MSKANTTFLIVLAALLQCCSDNMDMRGKGNITAAELKFPALYDIEWAMDLPKTDTRHLVANNVKTRISYLEVGDPSDYSESLQASYTSARTSESFRDWFINHMGCKDSAEFDESGKMTTKRRFALMSGTSIFKYDENGFRTGYIPGGCIIREYRFHSYCDEGAYMLYYGDTSIQLPSEENVQLLYFDTSGRLVNATYKSTANGYATRSSYIYDNASRIRQIDKTDSMTIDSDLWKAPGPKTTKSKSIYYYTGRHPDSIVTNYEVDYTPGTHHTEVIYFDATGLPIQKVHINFPLSHTTREVLLYDYIKRQ